jgi:pyruvate dehydrogenase E1 component alpha subunit
MEPAWRPPTPEALAERYPVSTEQMLGFYRDMVLLRRFEEMAAKAYTLKKILGFCHLYIGQEAVAVGATGALKPEDEVVAGYREHGQILARGASPRAIMAELFGKATGITHGIGGSMHLASKAFNFYGGYGIVGGHVPLGAGAAFASKYLNRGTVSLTYFGDGAAQQGAFFEALELSQLWKLPAVYLCENNFYAMGTSLERQSYFTDMSRRGDGVGMRRWQFEAFDVVDVYRNVAAAVDHARSGEGPVILEAVTYRYRGHSMSDPAKYRAAGELEEKKKRDGIDLARQRLVDVHGVPVEQLDAIVEEVKAICQDAYAFADSSPIPDPAHLYDYTYAE